MPEHINFHSLSVEKRRRFTKTFTDAEHPELEFEIQFEEPDALTDYAAAELSALLVARYIEGDPELGMVAQPFMVAGEARGLTPRLCDDVALIVAMQPNPWDLAYPPYQPEEVLQMAFKCRGLWVQVRHWAREIYRGSGDALPNVSIERGADSSSPRSKPDISIPASLTISAAASGP